MHVAISLRQSLLGLTFAGGMIVAGALPLHAADSAVSSFNFVNRSTMESSGAAESTGNPLRGSGGSNSSRAGSLRMQSEQMPSEDLLPSADEEVPADDGVVPASYNDGEQRVLKLRPHNEPTSGFLSGILSPSKPAQRPVAKKMQPTQDRPHFASPQLADGPPAKPQLANPQQSPAANRSQGLVPQFMAGAEKKLPNRPAPNNANNNQPRGPAAGQVAQANAAVPAGGGRPIMNAPNQAVYRTASSAAAYQPAGAPAGTAAASRRPTATTAAVPGRAQIAPPDQLQHELMASSPRPTAGPARSATPTLADAEPISPAAGALIRAHKLAGNARTEADYTKVYQTCQQVPANQATEAETTFGHELSAWALNRRGQLRAAGGKAEEALADFNAATRLNPSLWRAFHNRGVLEAQAGQFEPAFEDFRHTVELNPKFAKAYSNRAALYVLAGQLDLALRDYEQAVRLDPSLVVAQRGCGRTCHMMGRLDEGLAHLNAAVRCAPRDAAVLVSRGDLLSDLGHYSEASDDYEHAIEGDPKSADACRSSAWLLATCPDDSVRNPAVALERAELASRLERNADAATFDTLAAAQANVGDFGSAVTSIRRAIEIAPASEKSVYQDRLQMYRRSTPYRAEPVGGVQQAQYQQ